MIVDGVDYDDAKIARLVEICKDEWELRVELYAAESPEEKQITGARQRAAKTARYRACGHLFGAVDVPNEAETGESVEMPERPNRGR